MKVALCMLLAPAAALVAPPAAKAMSALQSTEYAQTLYGVGPETGFWDPLKLSDLGTDGTVDFFRAAEVKHGRIAMMATLGYMHHLAGITIPGSLSSSEGITFKSLGAMNPLEAWAAVPAAGVSQIFGAIALVEASEAASEHGEPKARRRSRNGGTRARGTAAATLSRRGGDEAFPADRRA